MFWYTGHVGNLSFGPMEEYSSNIKVALAKIYYDPQYGTIHYCVHTPIF